MISLDLFLSRLTPWVSGCPDPLSKQALVDAAIEFCDESHIVQSVLAPVGVSAGVSQYTLTLPTDSDCCATLKVWYRARELDPAPTSEIDNILAFASGITDAPQQTGEPHWFYEISPGVIGLYPVPSTTVASVLSVRVALKPSRAAATLSDTLYNDWVEGIVAGARARLHAVPAQFFSSDAKASQAMGLFRYYINRAKGVSIRGRLNGSLTVKPNRFF